MFEDMEINIKNYLPLREVVFNAIRDAIVSGKIPPGKRLVEKQLADKIGVSRTPVREALRKLELEGFIEMIPRKGALVKALNEKDIRDILEIRASLEGLAARLACANMVPAELRKLKKIKREFNDAQKENNLELMLLKDVELHDLIFESAKNKRLIQFINNLREQIYRLRLTYLKDDDFRDQIAREHDELVAAIERGDAEKAEAISTTHIKNQENAVIEFIKRNK
jgi:DNA-binding GntR family transcriptional regulator